MVKIALQIKAQLENITNLTPDGEDFRWYLKLKCLSCGDDTPDFVYLTLQESQPLKGGRGHASMVLKCKLCSRENSIDILPDTISTYTYDDCPRLKQLVVFDCRGVEPTSFSPRVGFCAEGVDSGTKFTDIDLGEGEWADYDEKAGESVSIVEIEHVFVKVK